MDETENKLWMGAMALFGAGDVATTAYGLQQSGVVEAHPVSAEILASGGVEGMIATKALFFTGASLLYAVSPEEHRVGVPLGLTVMGAGITIANTVTIAKAKGLI